MFGFLLIATLAMTVMDRGGEALYVMVGIFAAAVLVFAWLRRFALEVTETHLRYRTLWSERAVVRTDIRKVSLGHSYGTYFGPVVRLTIDLADPGVPPLVINAKVFSREAVRAVLSLDPRTAENDQGRGK
jgi:hypothetical protein